MKRFLLPWPLLVSWLIFSALVFYVGAAFGGSWTAFTVGPPLLVDPLGFVLWVMALLLVFAPVVLIAVRLLVLLFHRENNAPNH